ncbi:hypothetical protein [Halegenticoccus soli]|uniref:hypothetical protein n=1 Tax=Halegenticoccus soli TaxID=1985678 RepID=UPI000C6EE020|nr:hypothetical protein [Halegenticoccus soli]
MSKAELTDAPETYVREHRETLIEIIKHSDDDFVRALCLAALVKYGADPDVEQLQEEIARLDELQEKVR